MSQNAAATSEAARRPLPPTARPVAAAGIGPTLAGAEMLVRALEAEAVATVFSCPGGASLEIHEALLRSERIRTILPRGERGGVLAAAGHARATGRPGVCVAACGPGAADLVAGIAQAFVDAVPLVAILGELPLPLVGRGILQPDLTAITRPITKACFEVQSLAALPGLVAEAFRLSAAGRPGPVLIAFPEDLQGRRAWPEEGRGGGTPAPRAWPPDRRADHLAGIPAEEVISPRMVIEHLRALTEGGAIVVTGSGQRPPGTSGLAWPAALGAKLAFPDRQVVALDSDGSFLTTAHELATARIAGIAAKAVVLDSQHLAMRRPWEDRLEAGALAFVHLGDPAARGRVYPDLVGLVRSFDVPCERVLLRRELDGALCRMLAADGPYVLDVITPAGVEDDPIA